MANAMLLIIGRALNMLKSQIDAQGKAFEETGGFSERLTAKCLEAREKDQPSAPECPLCGKPMRRRNSTKGRFWGCGGFPDCKGTRPIGQEGL
ncbi:MAG: four helix bundle suffix domain-containing protein [Planctomycetes bacterium]|nr:four helix bundle suffix domain-containing protein [Planctomycetota bacterium]